ncbi:MAG: NAD-dependent epimerase/dehydratase family protein [Candidatus Alcyoniella australis]|nr:NAD-dependent epimerase/dehydratase family protein [Candidatus Alcyoniella australis]
MSEQYADFYCGKDVLITGGLGFIGSTLAHVLLPLGAKVTLVDSLIPQYGGNPANIAGIEDQVLVNIADVRDQYGMNHLVKGRDVIFNLAGTLSHIDSMLDPYTDLEINCRAQLSILEACRHNNPEVVILFAGTRGQYGRACRLPVDESHPMDPIDVNGVNNMAGEAYHLLYHRYYGIRAVSLRLTNTYGPRHQMHHSRQGIINWFVRLALEGKPIPMFGDGSQVRDANFVDDVVQAFLLAGCTDQAYGKVFNLGGLGPCPLMRIAELIAQLAGSPVVEPTDYPGERRGLEIGDYRADWSRAAQILGWQPTVELRDGLERTVEYYRTHRDLYW